MPDPTQVTAASSALTKIAEAAAKDIYANSKHIAKAALAKFLVEFGVGFKKFVDRNYQKCKFVKTLLHRIDPIDIELVYVDPTFRIANKSIAGSDFPSKLAELKNIIVVGLGGSGKSMFMKHVFLSLCEQPFGRIPLFIELRGLNDWQRGTLFSYIHNQWSELIPSFNESRLDLAFRAGKFILLLDGLDEVDFGARDDYCKQILQLIYKYPECLFVISSRPDDRFGSWNEFYQAAIEPLSRPQINRLIERISFDAETKERFLHQINSQLYRTHREFLSNPLLCTMMLMTFNEFEEIPSKMYIFYARAFEVLFTRHDKTKTFFQRKFHTDLAEDDFRRLFATFCLFSYLDGKFSFTRTEAIKCIEAAKSYEHSMVGASNFLADLSDSISVIVRDGEIYSFLHRSFQEYFVAVFLANRDVPNAARIYDTLLRSNGDSVLTLLFEMNREIFEMRVLRTRLPRINLALSKIDVSQNPAGILAIFFDEYLIEEGEMRGLRLSKWNGVLSLIGRLYKLPSTTRIIYCADDFFDHLIDYVRHSSLSGASTLRIERLPLDWIRGLPYYEEIMKVPDELRALEVELQNKTGRKKNFLAEILRHKA